MQKVEWRVSRVCEGKGAGLEHRESKKDRTQKLRTSFVYQ